MGEFLYRAGPWAHTLVAHNWPIMVCAVLIPLLAIRAYLRPTRRILLALYGVGLLALGFEYEKHGTGTVWTTTGYLFGADSNLAARQISRFFFLAFVPIAMYGGAVTLLVASAIPRRARRRWRAAPRANAADDQAEMLRRLQRVLGPVAGEHDGRSPQTPG